MLPVEKRWMCCSPEVDSQLKSLFVDMVVNEKDWEVQNWKVTNFHISFCFLNMDISLTMTVSFGEGHYQQSAILSCSTPGVPLPIKY